MFLYIGLIYIYIRYSPERVDQFWSSMEDVILIKLAISSKSKCLSCKERKKERKKEREKEREREREKEREKVRKKERKERERGV